MDTADKTSGCTGCQYFEEGSCELDIEDYRYINIEEHDWFDFIFEEWTEKLEKLGYSDIDIHFSGFSCQGDGASFTGYIDLYKWLENHNKAFLLKSKILLPGINIEQLIDETIDSSTLTRTYNKYVHEYSVTYGLSFNTFLANELAEGLISLEEPIQEQSRAYMKQIYKHLEIQYYELLTTKNVLLTLIEREEINAECKQYKISCV